MSERQRIDYLVRQGAHSTGMDDATRKTYSTASKNFMNFCEKEYGFRKTDSLESLDRGIVQEYANYLGKNYSTATAHTYLSPVCKAFHVPMKEITKDKRTIDRITRSRDAERNPQGRREAVSGDFNRLTAFSAAVGVRRAEYANLTAKDVYRGNDGVLYVHIDRGKGGKSQEQAILPNHEAVVLATIRGLNPDDRIFTREEMKNHIDLHHDRGAVAKEAYNYYAERLKADPAYRDELKNTLMGYFDEKHQGFDPKERSEKRERFEASLSKGDYILRGHTKEVALEKGLPIVYDRLAIIATSVRHLSHWRADVTVVNYLLSGY